MADRAAPDYKPVGEPERIAPTTTGHGDAPLVTALHRQSAALNGSVRVGSLSALGTRLSARAAPGTQGAVAQPVGEPVGQLGQLLLARRQRGRPTLHGSRRCSTGWRLPAARLRRLVASLVRQPAASEATAAAPSQATQN